MGKVGRPKERTARIELRLSPASKAKIDRIAAAQRRTATSIIDQIIENMPEPPPLDLWGPKK